MELRNMLYHNEDNPQADNISAAIVYIDCARWNIDAEKEIYKVSGQVVKIAE